MARLPAMPASTIYRAHLPQSHLLVWYMTMSLAPATILKPWSERNNHVGFWVLFPAATTPQLQNWVHSYSISGFCVLSGPSTVSKSWSECELLPPPPDLEYEQISSYAHFLGWSLENGGGSQETSELTAVHFRVLTVLCHLATLKVSMFILIFRVLSCYHLPILNMLDFKICIWELLTLIVLWGLVLRPDQDWERLDQQSGFSKI